LASLSRVLCPGGIIEIIEEDILFPTVWAPTVDVGGVGGTSMQSLRTDRGTTTAAQNQTVGLGYNPLEATNLNAQEAFLRPNPIKAEEIHSFRSYNSPDPRQIHDKPFNGPLFSIVRKFKQDHMVLEQLYSSVWKCRFINDRPTKIIPAILAMLPELGKVIASECIEIAKPGIGGATNALFPTYMVESDSFEELDYEEMSDLRLEPGHNRKQRKGIGSNTILDHTSADPSKDHSSLAIPSSQLLDDLDGPYPFPNSSPSPFMQLDEPRLALGNLASDEEETSDASTISAYVTSRETSPSEAEPLFFHESTPGPGPEASTTFEKVKNSGESRNKMKNVMSRTKRAGVRRERGLPRVRPASPEFRGDALPAQITPVSTEDKVFTVQRAKAKGKERSRLEQDEDPKGSDIKNPKHSLTSALYHMFPGLDSEITKTIHLMHAWESKFSSH
jgi:hypothetical protein